MNRIFSRTLLMLGACTVAGLVSAQEVVRPFMSRVVPAAVRDTTTRFVPQINDSIRVRAARSENSHIFTPVGESNNLVPGTGISKSVPVLGPKFRGIEFTGAFPPDCDISVGPDHIVTVVNTDWAIFNRTGTKLFQQSIDSLFSSQIAGGITSDPKVFYDVVSKRWFLSIINVDFAGESWQLLAVSDDTNPNGTWFKYKINTEITDGGTDFWLDYPNFGFNKDGIVISGNYFGYSSGFFGGGITVLPKAPLLNGGSFTANYFKPSGGTIQLTRSVDATVPRVYGVQPETTSSMKMFAFENLTGTPTMVTASVAVPQWQFPNEGRSAGGQTLDALDGRLLNCFLRNGKIVTAQSVLQNGDNVVRWYEFRPGNWPAAGLPTLFQSGNVKAPSSGTDAFMPAININAAGDIAVIYSVCNSSTPADLYSAGRKVTDARGAMGKVTKWATSIGSSYGANRWGDYFGLEVDPKDNNTFWGFGMVINNGGVWTTFVQNFKISDGGSGSSNDVVVPTNAVKYEGNQVFGTFASLATANDQYFTVSSAAVTRVGQVASAELSFTLPKTAANYSALTATLESAGLDTISASVFAYNWSTQKYIYVGAYPLTGLDARKVVKLPTVFSPFVSSTRQVKLLVRAVSPASISRAPLPFNFRMDQVQLAATPK